MKKRVLSLLIFILLALFTFVCKRRLGRETKTYSTRVLNFIYWNSFLIDVFIAVWEDVFFVVIYLQIIILDTQEFFLDFCCVSSKNFSKSRYESKSNITAQCRAEGGEGAWRYLLFIFWSVFFNLLFFYYLSLVDNKLDMSSNWEFNFYD